jgi:2-polyprenyl-6-hydroxyphenyl methylase/3-demethylubiquinone-9 3-methyltransferase
MTEPRKRYDADHWIRSRDPEEALAAYLDQQSKAYSRAKNAHIRELLGDLRGKRFLDYGCGGGLFTVHAATGGASLVVGVDAEESVISTARHYARKEGVERLCSFTTGETFPSFPPRVRFDVILIKDVIEHVRDDQRLLDAAAEVLAPGGIMVVSSQNSLSLNYLIQGTYHRLLRGDRSWYGWDSTHLRFYTPFTLRRKLGKAGLKTVGWRSAYIVPYKLPGLPGSKKRFLRIDSLSKLDLTLGRVFPFNLVGWNVAVKAEASRLAADDVKAGRALKKEPAPLATISPAVLKGPP